MILRKKVLRSLNARKSQYIGSVLLILISTLLFSAFYSAGTNVTDSLQQFRQQAVEEDAHFFLQAPLQEEAAWEARYDLTLEERTYHDVSFAKDALLRVLRETKEIDRYALLEGEKLTGADQILLDRGFADAHDLQIGDDLSLPGGTFHVVGFMTVPDYIYPLKSETDLVKNPQAFGVAVVTADGAARLGDGSTFYSVTFGKDNKEAFKSDLQQNNFILRWIDKQDNQRMTFVDGDVKGALQVAEVLPVAILLLTIVLVSSVFSRLLKQEYVQIGTLYALGYRKREILRHYLGYPTLLALIGGGLGTVLGVLLSPSVQGMFASFYNLPPITGGVSLGVVLISLLLPFVFLLPATAYLILRVLRLPPLHLMSGQVTQPKIGRLEKRFRHLKLRFAARFQVRELLRNSGRNLLMIVGTAFASMLLLFGFVTQDSMDSLMGEQYEAIYRYNYQYLFNTFQQDPPQQGEKLSLAAFDATTASDKKTTILVYGIEPDAELIRFQDEQGARLDFQDNIMTKSLAKQLDVQAGDDVSLVNQLTSETVTLHIDRIADSYLGNLIYLPLDRFNELNGFPQGSYLGVITNDKAGYPADQLYSVTDSEELQAGYQAMIEPLRYMVFAIAGVAIVIALIVIQLLTSMLIEESQQKVSMLKVLGYRPKELYKLLLGPNTWLVLIGYLLAVPLTILSLQQMFNSLTEEMNVSFPIQLNAANFFIGLAIMLVTYQVSKLFAQRKLKKVSLQASLKAARD
ncbi:MAG TPA: FtsX-like permease family protein [Bacilli bacterium]|nr:FtsX-like permease family protein [Bacilli bacterium]